MYEQQIETAVKTHLPDRFLTSVIRVAFEARKQAHDHCVAEFADEEYVNVMPGYLRGKTEGLIRGTAALFPKLTTDVINCSGWRHTEITTGPIKCTAHAVKSPCALVDDAEYRRSLAESQPSFFSPTSFIPDAKLYALILHGPYLGRNHRDARQYRYLPGSMYLAFPECARRGYAYKINLFDRFPKVVESLLPKEWDQKAVVRYKWQARLRVA
jgi:hypothetical protein